MFRSSIEVSRKLLQLDTGADQAVRAKILASVLSDGVSAFDALGKALRANYPSVLPAHPKNLFQNLVKLEEVLKLATVPSLTASLSVDDYAFLLRLFQVRHISEHNAGVVDAEFCQKVPGTRHLLQRKYPLAHADVERFLDLLPALADAVTNRLSGDGGVLTLRVRQQDRPTALMRVNGPTAHPPAQRAVRPSSQRCVAAGLTESCWLPGVDSEIGAGTVRLFEATARRRSM